MLNVSPIKNQNSLSTENVKFVGGLTAILRLVLAKVTNSGENKNKTVIFYKNKSLLIYFVFNGKNETLENPSNYFDSLLMHFAFLN